MKTVELIKNKKYITNEKIINLINSFPITEKQDIIKNISTFKYGDYNSSTTIKINKFFMYYMKGYKTIGDFQYGFKKKDDIIYFSYQIKDINKIIKDVIEVDITDVFKEVENEIE